MSVKPLEDRVLIRPIEAESRTESGIYLPESAKEKPMHGKVVAMGPGKLLDKLLDKPGALIGGAVGLLIIIAIVVIARKKSKKPKKSIHPPPFGFRHF